MSHTNSTTNYHLPQFVTTDKPAWLTDINGAFSDIDTAIDSAKDTADAAASDASDALTAATNAGTTATAADGKGSGALASIAPAFDSTSTYSVGAIVIYNSLLYKCTTAITTPGAWTGSTNWTRTTVTDIDNGFNTRITAIENALPSESTPSITLDNDVTGVNISVDKISRSVVMSIECTPASATLNTWKSIGYVATASRPNVSRILAPALKTADGTEAGMIEISGTDGKIRLYAKQSLSNNAIAWSIAYRSAE